MTDPESLVARLDVIEARLAAHTDSERPGLTRAPAAATKAPRRDAPPALLRDVRAGIAAAAALCRSLSTDEWQASGAHPTPGALTGATIGGGVLVGPPHGQPAPPA